MDESLGKLKFLSKISKDDFLKNTAIHDIAKWNFYITAQACLDLGNHLIHVKGLELPETYEDIIRVLEINKIISKKLALSLQGIGGFRNLIAHGYFKIDLEKLYSYLKELKNIKKFLSIIRPYLEKHL